MLRMVKKMQIDIRFWCQKTQYRQFSERWESRIPFKEAVAEKKASVISIQVSFHNLNTKNATFVLSKMHHNWIEVLQGDTEQYLHRWNESALQKHA